MTPAAALVPAALLLVACAVVPNTPPAATAAAAATPSVPALRNPGFEEPTPAQARCPAGWECSAHVDVGSFTFRRATEGATGAASLCIERVGKEPWALLTQGFHTTAMRGRTLRLSMAMRAQGLAGGAGPWIQSQGGRAHAAKLVQATNGWERVSVDLAIPAESNLLVVGATLEGPGSACFDDVRLEVL
jgi:hypothetical protein